jgi:N-methylhydantoinase A
MPLEIENAREAISRCVAQPLGCSETEAARAIVQIAVMNMSLAVRQVSVERGYDPRDFVMVAFGGAGPLHAAEVARSLHIPLLLIPNFPGQFSAGGMLLAEPRHDFVRTYYRSLDQTDFKELARIAAEMEQTARDRMGPSERHIRTHHTLEVRYTSQDFALPIPVDPICYSEDYKATIRKMFHQLHEARFGYHDPDLGLEIVNAHLVATGPQKLQALARPWSLEGPKLLGTRRVIFDTDGIECPVYRRESLAAGERIAGPAIIQEYASTTVLFAADRAEVMPSGELLIDVGEVQ